MTNLDCSFQFFSTKPLPCDPSSLPKYPPSKEFDAKIRDEEARRYLIYCNNISKSTIYFFLDEEESYLPHRNLTRIKFMLDIVDASFGKYKA